MRSFFSSIKNYFAGTFAGRYDEIILREVSQECPAMMRLLYKDFNSSKHEIKLEYWYKKGKKVQKGKGGGIGRRADIAILEGKRVCCLIEIKVDDSPLKGQLEDYINYSKKHNVEFVYLTRHKPCNDDLYLLEKYEFCKHIMFSDLYDLARNSVAVMKSAFGKTYLKYLEDNGDMFTEIDPKGVKKFLTRMFLPWGGNGRIRNTKDMVDTIPSTFKNLMNNLYIINEEIKGKIDCQVTIDYAIFPYIKKIDDKEYDKDGICRDVRKGKSGGEIYLYASGSFAEKPSIVIEYGLCLRAEPKNKKKYYYNLYSSIFLSGYSVSEEKSTISEKQLSNKDFCVEKLTELTKNALQSCVENKDVKHAKKKIKNSLKMLNV